MCEAIVTLCRRYPNKRFGWTTTIIHCAFYSSDIMTTHQL